MGSVAHCSLCYAKQLPKEVGLVQYNFSDEKFVLVAVLSEKLQYLCFSQVPAGSDYPLFPYPQTKKRFSSIVYIQFL
ncbi:hypothetical protein HMPREF9124_1464 [Oribacterium sp. oral taxon 108 str. F0425]|nr:hypothetical protein HMPREF9124_1464 [Oribacterium sp. oral taxon 108 str. F0425]